MHSSVEQIQILYEIAMSIGASLDLRKMLRQSLSTFLKKLNCSAGGIYFLNQENNPYLEKIYTIPRNAEKNEACRAALQQLPPITTPDQWVSFSQMLPISGQSKQGNYFHILELPQMGLMFLVKNGKDLDPFVIKSLTPLLAKLADACRACLQNEETEQSHQLLVEINFELAEKSSALNESRNDLLNTLRELRRVSARNQALLDGIPDAMLYLNRAGEFLDYKAVDEEELSLGVLGKITGGQNLREMLPPDIFNLILRNINKTLNSGEMQVFEYQLSEGQKKQDFEARLVASGPDEALAIIRNISKRKRAEEQIEILAKFPNENPDPVLRVDKDGVILYANNASRSLLDEWGSSIGQLVSDDWLQLIEDSFNFGSSESVEVQCSGRIYSLLVVPVIDAGYVNLYGSDITVRKQALASQTAIAITNAQLVDSLQENEARMSGIINTAPDGIITIGKNGLVELFNPAAEKIFGYRSDEIMGKNVKMLMPSPYREQRDDFIANYLKTDHKKIIGIGREVFGQRKDGTVFPMYLAIGEVSLSHRTIFTGIIQDITERKQAEEDLRESEERLNSTLTSMDDMVFVLDKFACFIDYYQPPSRPDLYLPPKAFIGQPFKKVLPPHIVEPLGAAIDAVEATNTVQQFDYSLEVDDKAMWFNAKVSMRKDSSGEFAGVTIVVRDITERYELEKMRDDFVSTVTHELKTPLASVMGWTETLLGERPGPLTDRQRRFLKIVEESSERLDKLIDEILTVSRIQQGTFKLDIRPFSPYQAIQNAQNLVTPLAGDKSILLEVHNDWPAKEHIAGDQSRLEQVIINLVGNAIKFTSAGGQVRVYSHLQNGSWYLRVEDTGIGIPKADIPRLFQRFYRASNVTEAQIQGTGLGLYVCKAIIEGHGGQIGLESKVGQGTTVWFTLPQS